MLISICIPTYNSGEKLERLLDSIKIQTFKDFEIIVSDDSRNDSVKQIIDSKYADLNIKYYWNEEPLKNPGNWTSAVEKSSGEWINLMHHDDWFANENSLQEFVVAAKTNSHKYIIFCAFENVYLDNGTQKKFYWSNLNQILLKLNYLNLYRTFLPNPSCTLINKKYKPYCYDKNFKWLIDFDFYTTLLKKHYSYFYINKVLVNVGMHSGQVTAEVFGNPSVEIPETIGLLNKHGEKILKNVFVYDFYWRMYRNLGVRSLEQFNSYLNLDSPFKSINRMIYAQSRVNANVLKNGFANKFFMIVNFIKNVFLN
jgi:glycosyltransferase involved in cell wall biosynthesis